MFYQINLLEKHPEIKTYDDETIRKDLKYFNFEKIEQLIDFDFKLFSSIQDASDWLNRYNRVDLSAYCKRKDVPHMLLKRRYMRQVIMREKLYTCRTYNKKWEFGQLFNFFDQTYFITCRLVSIIKRDDGYYQYNYSLT